MNDTLFYVAQKAFIKKGDEVLVLLKDGNRVDFPGGKISTSDTDLTESLKREVLEETALSINVNKPFHTWTFTLPQSHKNAGQKVFVVGYESDYISGDIKISDEHMKSVWVNKDNFNEINDNSIWFEVLKIYFSTHNN